MQAIRLSPEMIIKSSEIQEWLLQFKIEDRPVAETMLLQLKFITRDSYAKWLKHSLENVVKSKTVGIFAVRKLREEESVWDGNKTGTKSSESQGSEDFVLSILQQLIRSNKNILDHPSIDEMRLKKVHEVILVDDSIGSGKRVSKYIKSMIANESFLSWLSGGFITITVVSYARTIQSEQCIYSKFPGSNHGLRKRKKTDKLKFYSLVKYDATELQYRWGNDFQRIEDLCSNANNIKKSYRMGYGDVMANFVFYHSVPNNLPGVLHIRNSMWKPLFCERVLPSWCVDLLNGRGTHAGDIPNYKRSLVYFLLLEIKRGLKTVTSLSRRTDTDVRVTKQLLEIMVANGLITDDKRITKAGLDFIYKERPKNKPIPYDYSLYIPKSWCTSQEETQPSVYCGKAPFLQTDSMEENSIGGDSGKLSLERTDDIASSTLMINLPNYLSWPRNRQIDNDPAD